MLARLIAYPPDAAAIVRTARPGERLRIGRAPDNDLRLDHPSVSRAHAELEGLPHGWQLRDLGSKNGTFIDGHAIRETPVPRAAWIRFGDVHCEYVPLTAAELAREDAGRAARRTVATALTARLEHIARIGDLLDASVRSVLDISQCERGFLLLEDGADFRVRSAQALDPQRLPDRAFSGSVGAVRRALEERRVVVANDVSRDAWLSNRDSVVAGGLHALLCLPLLDGDRTLGAIYADRTGPGQAITTLDLELLQAFAEHAAVWIAARRATERLAQPMTGDAPRWSRIVAAQAEVA